jgi:hypothetical protein
MRKIVFVIWVLTFCSKLFSKEKVAHKPPLGWNSFDAFYATVTDEEPKENEVYMKTLLVPYGWEYIVIDYCWSYPTPGLQHNRPNSVPRSMRIDAVSTGISIFVWPEQANQRPCAIGTMTALSGPWSRPKWSMI